MIHRKRLSAPVLLLVGVMGSAVIGNVGFAAPAVPAPNSCFIDVVPSAGDQPMALDVTVKCAVTGVLSIRANSRQSANFFSKFTNAAGEDVKPDGRVWKLPA